MSRHLLRCGVLLAVLFGAAATAQNPPAVLPAPRPTPVEVPESPLSEERTRLQEQLKELLRRLNDRPPVRPAPKAELIRPTPRTTFDPGDLSKAVDGLRSATDSFRNNDIDAALRTFRLLDTASFTREDRAFVQYMTACCLRKLGRTGEAAAQYREVAEAKDDEFLSDCAVWQLSLIRSAQELQAQLEQLRAQQRESESRPKKAN